MRHIIFLLLSLVATATASGQSLPSFEQMKQSLTAQSLPLVNISVDLSTVNRNNYTPAAIEIVDPKSRTNGQQDITFSCKVRYRGSSSLNYEKKSFAVKLLDDAGKSLDANILGIRKDDSWILDAMAIDRIRMRNRVLFDIWNAYSTTPYSTDYDSRNGTTGHFVELFISGQYHGLYCLSDKINRKLLELKKAKEADDGSVTVRGLLLKCESWGGASFLTDYDSTQPMTGETWNSWELQYPDDYPSSDTYMPLANLIDFMSTSTDEEFSQSFDQWYYLQPLLDYHVFLRVFGIEDNLWKNTFLSVQDLTKGHRFLLTPWDLDTSLGGFWEGSHNDVLKTDEAILWVYPYRRLSAIGDFNYKEQLSRRWGELYKSTLSEQAIVSRIDAYAQQFTASGAWSRERQKWNNNPVPLTETPDEELSYVKSWLKRSLAAMIDDYGDGNSSGIEVLPTSSAKTKQCYNLAGQPVGASYKGIVIENGRKRLIK